MYLYSIVGVSSGKKYNNKNHLAIPAHSHTTIPHLLSLDRPPATVIEEPGGVDGGG